MSSILNRIATTNNNGGADHLYQQMEQTGEEVSGTLSFRDGSTQWMSSMVDAFDSTRDVTYHEDVPLADFFARPAKVASYTWSTSDISPFFQTLDPWSLFFNNVRFSNRLSNFQNFSGNVHMKFVINGNSFLYGRLMADYFPMRAFDNWSVTAGGAAGDVVNLTQASQRLHLYLDPCESQAGELALPFIWPYDKINMPAGDFTSLGTMYLRQLQPLKHANGATASINISVFVWATNVKLSIPTVVDIAGIAPQAGSFDEYGKGPVSGIASAIAGAAGRLVGVPVIGRYARATQMMSGALGGVASLFGFSRPAIIADYSDMHPTPVSRIANYNVSDNCAKLSMDAKQELTIDPTVIGISPGDEMAISALAGKESYLVQFPWTVARVANDILWTSRVGPLATISGGNIYNTALSYATLPFQYWRGSIVYRFQIVASGFHKGRLLIVWDPYAQGSGPETNVQYSKIVDLADERDFTFEVGWGASRTYLPTPAAALLQAYRTTPAWNTPDASWNGVVSVYVLNELTTPNSTVNNDIAINVFVSGCADYKVAAPSEVNIRSLGTIVALTPQSGTFEEVDTEEKNAPRHEEPKETIAVCQPLRSDADSVYFGEVITSLRQLIRRYSLWASLLSPTVATVNVQTLQMPDFPPPRGYSAYGAVLKTANNYNPAATTMLNYLSFGYMAFRGGLRHKVVMGNAVTANGIVSVVSRDSTLGGAPGIYARGTAEVITTQLAFAVNRTNNIMSTCQSGGHINTYSQQPTMEFELPMYRDHRFAVTRTNGYRSIFGVYLASHTMTTAVPASIVPMYDVYVAGAEDATFMCFQGCVPLQIVAVS